MQESLVEIVEAEVVYESLSLGTDLTINPGEKMALYSVCHLIGLACWAQAPTVWLEAHLLGKRELP